jgi:alkylation response protein AidB-like acyl-CoA dehydrogenase
VDLEPSSEQSQIAASIGALVDDVAPLHRTRELLGSDRSFEPDVWTRLADLGLFALGLPEAHSGAGYDLPEEALAFEQLGRRLVPGPLVATLLAARLAAEQGLSTLAEEIVSGAAPVAHLQPHGRTGARVGTSLDGRFTLVDAPGSRYGLAVTPASAALVELAAMAPGSPVVATDPTSRVGVADLSLPAVVSARTEDLWRRGVVLTAALLVGISRATLEASVSYVTVREQFGQPVGAFQAVKHRCADMAVLAAAAEAQTRMAALVAAADRDDAPMQVSAAKVVALRAAEENAAVNVLNHGGIGFTAEHDAHLYVRRAAALRRAFGDAASHRAGIAALPRPA